MGDLTGVSRLMGVGPAAGEGGQSGGLRGDMRQGEGLSPAALAVRGFRRRRSNDASADVMGVGGSADLSFKPDEAGSG